MNAMTRIEMLLLDDAEAQATQPPGRAMPELTQNELLLIGGGDVVGNYD